MAIAATILSLQGCGYDYATFATVTHLGIKADTKTEQVSIGLGRSNVFLAPAYPDRGTAPSAFGYLTSNAQVFTPDVTQLYATGSAADTLAEKSKIARCNSKEPSDTKTLDTKLPDANPVDTKSLDSEPSDTKNVCTPDLSGERRPMVFATNTNVGLKVGFVANAPSTFNFGYDREEMSLIPFHSAGAGGNDTYAPVIGAVSVKVQTATDSNSGFALTDFFATGHAAEAVAADPSFQTQFFGAAQSAVKQAVDEKALQAAEQAD